MDEEVRYVWHGNTYWGHTSAELFIGNRIEGEALSMDFDRRHGNSLRGFFGGKKQRMDWTYITAKDWIGLKKIYDKGNKEH